MSDPVAPAELPEPQDAQKVLFALPPDVREAIAVWLEAQKPGNAFEIEISSLAAAKHYHGPKDAPASQVYGVGYIHGGSGFADSFAEIIRAGDGHPWHCPKCLKGSSNPEDARNSYCRDCEFVGDQRPRDRLADATDLERWARGYTVVEHHRSEYENQLTPPEGP